MNKDLTDQLEGLLEKYTELLVGDGSEENQQKVRAWIFYNHISKTMPSLAKHWNEMYPDAKEEIKQVILEVKILNEKTRKHPPKNN